MIWTDPTPASALSIRRMRLSNALGDRPALLFAGLPRARNYPANRHPFRAESHFLYFTGVADRPGSVLLVDGVRSLLFVEPKADDDALWHGESESDRALAARTGVDDVRPLSALPAAIAGRAVATIPTQDEASAALQSELVGRPIVARSGARLDGIDAVLADAIISLRLAHDEAALAQIRRAVEVTTRAHRACARALRIGDREAVARGAFEAELIACGMAPAYGSIVTTRGEILHQERSDGVVRDGDLLLVDAAAETGEGWASDVTRVYPASGRFSGSQRAIYDVVLSANRAAIAKVRPGVRYREVHLVAARALLSGLVDLGIFRGEVDGLVERGAHAIFFPHGVGHLLGLDVHDLEDLGDRAGYAPGRTRATRFGDRYLRLDRDLVPGMVVTIEPGFYQVPAILADDTLVGPFARDLDRARLSTFADVRGIRLEDDVLCTTGEPEILSKAVPIEPTAVEAWMHHA